MGGESVLKPAKKYGENSKLEAVQDFEREFCDLEQIAKNDEIYQGRVESFVIRKFFLDVVYEDTFRFLIFLS